MQFNGIKDKNHTVVWIAIERKLLDKIEFPFMLKVLKKLGHHESHLNTLKFCPSFLYSMSQWLGKSQDRFF